MLLVAAKQGLISPGPLQPQVGGGAVISRRPASPGDGYDPFIAVGVAGTEASGYAVSTALEFDRWIVLGSPQDLGPVVCDMTSKRTEE